MASVGIPNHRIWPSRFPEADARLKATRPVLAEIAEANNLPAENLLTPDFLRQICFEPPALDAEAISTALLSLGARPWQTQLVSGPLTEALMVVASEESSQTAR